MAQAQCVRLKLARAECYALTGEDPALFALGIHGQWLFVDRARNLVIAKVSSQNEPLDPEKIALAMSAFRAIQQFLR
jgi:CubicO group peptidase (beta-lactamase class C family)